MLRNIGLRRAQFAANVTDRTLALAQQAEYGEPDRMGDCLATIGSQLDFLVTPLICYGYFLR